MSDSDRLNLESCVTAKLYVHTSLYLEPAGVRFPYSLQTLYVAYCKSSGALEDR